MNQKILTKKKKKGGLCYFQNFSWFQFYVYKICMMIDEAVFHKILLILVDENLCENCSYFPLKWFLLNSFRKMSFLEESYKQVQKNSNFFFFFFWEWTLYEIREYAFFFLKNKTKQTAVIIINLSNAMRQKFPLH